MRTRYRSGHRRTARDEWFTEYDHGADDYSSVPITVERT
jgi:hypothetical protein